MVQVDLVAHRECRLADAAVPSKVVKVVRFIIGLASPRSGPARTAKDHNIVLVRL